MFIHNYSDQFRTCQKYFKIVGDTAAVFFPLIIALHLKQSVTVTFVSNVLNRSYLGFTVTQLSQYSCFPIHD
jgi:hypothetical protein